MGGRGRSRTQRKHFQQSRENVWKRPKPDDSAVAKSDDIKIEGPNRHWEPFAAQNHSFDEYYKEQGVVSTEEWDVFVEYLRKPLPAAFRINSSSPFYEDILLQLENDFAKSIQTEDDDGSEVDPIRPLPWYPDNLAWQSNFSRNQLRKDLTLERFHEFLKLENEIGNITRQEAVSMVPPLFLDVRPEHFVLDMCAAPGSKTFQLLEMIYKLTPEGTLPSGLVIANDLDVQRCNLLIHQTKRMCTANLIVTNHEAQHFPSCHFNKNLLIEQQGITQLQFDRVLCDVPCSGDGTLRKAPDIWRKWNTGMGNGLHGLQVQIAMRGLSLLKIGGRMVYSTCSMNPVENEAVVSELLRRCEGSIELLDVSSELPDLVRRPGLTKWKVHNKGLWLASYKDVPKHHRSVIKPGMFPSGKSIEDTADEDNHENGNIDSEIKLQMMDDDSVAKQKIDLVAESSDLPLERCMRIVPHDQNSGAFFIAVIQKLSPIPAPCTAAKKPVTQFKKMDQSEKLKNQVQEDSNGNAVNMINEKDVQVSESTRDGIIAVYESSGEASQDIDQTENDENFKSAPSTNTKTGENTVTAGNRKLQIQGRWRGVDPVIFYKDDAVIDMIIEFYGIKDAFPFKGHLITRNDDANHVKRIYYVSDSVKSVLELNLRSGQHLKIASVGLKMFERQTSKTGTSAPCLFRISSEGLPLILPHITKQILYANPVDFKHLLQYKSIKFSDFVDPNFGDEASKLIMLGCCVVVLRKESRDSSSIQAKEESRPPIAIGCWRGRTSISVMVTAIDCQELLERVSMLVSTGNNNSDYSNNNNNDISATSEAVKEENITIGSQVKEDDDTTM